MIKSDNKNIILTGFMGTGKSTVGKLLASKLSREFIDTDLLIEKRQRLTIAEIFNKFGEAAFRQMETEIAVELGKRERLVISTGGRMLLEDTNVIALSSNGRIFCLVASPQEIIARLKTDSNNPRPLLDVPGLDEYIPELLQERKKGYKRFVNLPTDGKRPVEIAEDLIELIAKN